MKNQNTSTVRLEIIASSIFGDAINGRLSERGRFKLNGIEFTSAEPTCRREANTINHAMNQLRNALEATRSTP